MAWSEDLALSGKGISSINDATVSHYSCLITSSGPNASFDIPIY